MTELAAKWLRVSSTGQDEAHQEPDLDSWIDDHEYKLALGAGDRGVYRLHGRSASKGQHQAMLDRVVADMAAGKFSVLVVWQSSRIERRGTWSVFDLFRRVREAGGRIEFVQDSYLNESNEMSDVMLALAATKDRQKSRDLQKQSRSAHAKIDANEALRTKAPFGYAITGEEKYAKQLTPTRQGREIVPQVFERVAGGQSCQSVAAWFEEQTGRPVWARFIAGMIRQTGYYGDLKWTHTEIDKDGNPAGTVEKVHRCEPLVPYALWERANARLNTVPRRGRTARAPHLLKGVGTCGECGGTLVRMDGNHRGVSPTWWLRCIGTPDGKAQRKCGVTPAVMVPYEAVAAAVEEVVGLLGDRPVVTRTLVHGETWDSEIRLTERRLRELHKQVPFDDPAYLVRQGELLAELAELKARPVEEDRWDETPTGQKHRDLWDACTDDAERNQFLAANRYRIRVYRDRLDVHTEQESGIPGTNFTSGVDGYPLAWVPRRRRPDRDRDDGDVNDERDLQDLPPPGHPRSGRDAVLLRGPAGRQVREGVRRHPEGGAGRARARRPVRDVHLFGRRRKRRRPQLHLAQKPGSRLVP
jgi:DNA invertase Pin-like site-specific DNA recombinase